MEIISCNFLVFLLITIPVYYTLTAARKHLVVVASAASSHAWLQNLIR
jgi:hypothetical protein